MKKGLKYTISNALSGNTGLNKKVISIKRSWDEVETIISKGNKSKPK